MQVCITSSIANQYWTRERGQASFSELRSFWEVKADRRGHLGGPGRPPGELAQRHSGVITDS